MPTLPHLARRAFLTLAVCLIFTSVLFAQDPKDKKPGDVMIEKFRALSSIAKEADIKWIMSGQNAQSFFGLNLNAEGGANLDQFLKESGIDVNAILEAAKTKKTTTAIEHPAK